MSLSVAKVVLSHLFEHRAVPVSGFLELTFFP